MTVIESSLGKHHPEAQLYQKVPVVIWAYQTDTTLQIDTLEGTMTATPGDWIIQGINGEQYPCKPGIFELTYRTVDVSTKEVTSDNGSGRLMGGRNRLPLALTATEARLVVEYSIDPVRFLVIRDEEFERFRVPERHRKEIIAAFEREYSRQRQAAREKEEASGADCPFDDNDEDEWLTPEHLNNDPSGDDDGFGLLEEDENEGHDPNSPLHNALRTEAKAWLDSRRGSSEIFRFLWKPVSICDQEVVLVSTWKLRHEECVWNMMGKLEGPGGEMIPRLGARDLVRENDTPISYNEDFLIELTVPEKLSKSAFCGRRLTFNATVFIWALHVEKGKRYRFWLNEANLISNNRPHDIRKWSRTL